MRSFVGVSLLCVPLLLAGCDLASSPTGSTVLKGANVAIGGVNLQDSTRPSSETWDRHITSCHYDPNKKELRFGGDGNDYLHVSLPAETHRATVNGSSGVLIYEGDACRVFKLDLSHAAAPFDGHISVVCSKGKFDLTAAARFERCGS